MSNSFISSIHQTQEQGLPSESRSEVSSRSGSDTEGRQKEARPKLFGTPSSATNLGNLESVFSPKSRSRSSSFLSKPFSRSNSNLSAHSLALQSQHQKLTQDSNVLLWDAIKQQRECAAARREFKSTITERDSLEEQLKKLIPRIEKIRAQEIEQKRALGEEEVILKSIYKKDDHLRSKMKEVLSEMDDNLPYKREVLKQEKKEEARWQKEDERELKEEQREEVRRRAIEQQQKSAEDVKSHHGGKINEDAAQNDKETKGKPHVNVDGKRVDETDRRKEVDTPRSGKTADRRNRKEIVEFQRGLFKQKHPGASHSYIVYQ